MIYVDQVNARGETVGKDYNKKEDTFILKILNNQNATWQGSVTWIDENKTLNFRSAMELLKILDDVVKSNCK